MLTLAILSADPSGDLQAAALLKRLKPAHPDWNFVGVGGEHSRRAGLELWADSSLWSIIGATEAISRIPRFIYDYWVIRQRLLRVRPDLIVFIDSPAVHMRLSPVMKRNGLRCCYYFPPSGWSRSPKRLRDIHSRADALIPTTAFAAEQYRQNKLPVAYFGHPLVDLCVAPPRALALEQLGLPEGRYGALLPGSRTQEIRLLLPTFLEVARRLHQESPDLIWLLPAVNPPIGRYIRQLLPDPPPWLRLIDEHSRTVMSVAQAGLLASGSATLEACLLNLPLLICYRFNPIDYVIATWLLRLKIVQMDFFGLPNLLMQEKVVPELLQDQANPAALVELLRPLLQDTPARRQALENLARVRERLGPPGAIARVTDFIERMIQGQSRDEALA